MKFIIHNENELIEGNMKIGIRQEWEKENEFAIGVPLDAHVQRESKWASMLRKWHRMIEEMCRIDGKWEKCKN